MRVVESLTVRSVSAVVVVLAAAYTYFFPLPGYNQDSRLDLTRSIVEHGTLSIDAYHHNTGDKALFAGHYYSDKAPGQALLAVPAVAVITAVACSRSAVCVEPRFPTPWPSLV
jgi:hypothetical protein